MEGQNGKLFEGRSQRRRRSYRAETLAPIRLNKCSIQTDSILKSFYSFHNKIEKTGSHACQFFKATNKASEISGVLKVQPVKVNPANQTLLTQFRVMRQIGDLKGIPRIINFGKTPTFYFLQIEEYTVDLGNPPHELKSSTSILCDIAIEIVQILRSIHQRNIIHRDLQPQNIILNKNGVRLVGFGKSCPKTVQKARSPKTFAYGTHYFVGVPKYASISAHRGQLAHISDDIESMLYILIEIRNGSLPWSYIKDDDDTIMKIGKTKKKISRQELCRGMPACFLKAFDLIDIAEDHESIYDQIIDDFKYDRDLEISKTMKDSKINSQIVLEELLFCSVGNILQQTDKQDEIDENNPPTILVNNDLRMDFSKWSHRDKEADTGSELKVGEEYEETGIPLSIRVSKLVNEAPKFKGSRNANT